MFLRACFINDVLPMRLRPVITVICACVEDSISIRQRFSVSNSLS